MSVRHPGASRERAEAVANENLRRLEQPVLRSVGGRLRAGHTNLDPVDLEAAYNQAWHGVYQSIAQGREVENLTGLLIDITYKRAIDIYRQRNEALHTQADLAEHPVEVDLADQLDDQRKIDRLIERLKDRLNTNERNAVTLCVLHGYTRPEAAERLGIPERAFQKIMDSATKKITKITGAIEAQGCGGEEWARALRSYALGITGPDETDYRRISEHLKQCASCQRYVTGLRGLAAVLPPIFPLGPAAAGGGLLAYLYKVFAPAHSTGTIGGGAATAQTTLSGATGAAATTGSTVVGSGGGGGLVSVLGGLKVAVLVVGVAGAAAAGTVSVAHLASRHSPAAQANINPTPVQLPQAASSPGALLSSPTKTHKSRSSADRRKRHARAQRRPRNPRHVAAERSLSTPPSQPSSTSVVPQATVATSTPTAPAPESGSRGEFGFEGRTK